MSALPTPTLSATIGGAITNRVKVRKPRRSRQRRIRSYDADRETIGKGTVQACLSLPPALLAALDSAAKRARKSRSHFVRLAVERLIAEGK